MNKKVTFLPQVELYLQQKLKRVDRLIEQGQSELALEKINILIQHEYKLEQTYLRKLHCLRESHKWQEVERIAELMRHCKDRSISAEYNMYYLLSLYEQGHYGLVIEVFEDEKPSNGAPKLISEMMDQLYHESQQKLQTTAKEIVEQLKYAIIVKDDRKQWSLFHKWNTLNVPPPTIFLTLLEQDDVNPFVKTYILQALKRWQIEEEVTIVKNNHKKRLLVQELPLIEEHAIYVATLQHISKIEQQNPTLYKLVLELLDCYVSYIYPYFYKEQQIKDVSHAAQTIARKTLEGMEDMGELSSELLYFMEEIERSNEAYFRLHII